MFLRLSRCRCVASNFILPNITALRTVFHDSIIDIAQLSTPFHEIRDVLFSRISFLFMQNHDFGQN